MQRQEYHCVSCCTPVAPNYPTLLVVPSSLPHKTWVWVLVQCYRGVNTPYGNVNGNKNDLFIRSANIIPESAASILWDTRNRWHR